MAHPTEPPNLPSPHEPTALRNAASGCLAALMAIVGLILLLPGGCALYAALSAITTPGVNSRQMVPVLLLAGLTVCAAAFGLLWAAGRVRR